MSARALQDLAREAITFYREMPVEAQRRYGGIRFDFPLPEQAADGVTVTLFDRPDDPTPREREAFVKSLATPHAQD